MNTTPNYGFKDKADIKLCAIDAIDRELHRIEQQTQCGLAAKADKCALEKLAIQCHNCHKPPCDCDCYTKAQVDELLAKKADIHPPELYPLELADGLEAYGQRCVYCKTQNGFVYVEFWCVRTDGEPLIDTPTGSVEIAYLPEGYRPFQGVHVYGGLASTTGYRQGTRFSVSSSGIIKMQPFYDADLSYATSCNASFSFFAAP